MRAFSKADNPNEVLILGQYADKAKAVPMFQSQELCEAMACAGIQGPQEFTFLDEVINLPT